MAKNTTLAWASFQSHEEADQARNRLEEAGYARNSIEIDRRHDGTFTVEVHTREENLPHVEQLLHTSGPMYAARQLRSGVVDTVMSNPLVVLGGAALAGLVIYSLLPSQRRRTVYSIRKLPNKVREAVQDLPETISDTVSGLTGGRQEQPHGGARQAR